MAELTKQMQALLDRREALVAQDQGYRTLLSQLQERTTQAQALLTKKTAESSFEISDIESSIKRAETDISFIPQYQRRVQELDAEIKKAEEVSAKVQECMGRQQALNRSLQDYQQRVTVASQATGTCPVCGEKIPAERWQEILAGMKTEMGKLVVELSEIDRFLKTSMQMHSPAQLRMEMESQQNKVTQATGKVVTRQELMDRLVRAKEKRDQTLKELADNLNELTQRSDETRGKLNAEVEVLASQIETLKRGHKELNDQMLAWVGTRVTRENAELDRRDAEKTLELNQQLEVSVQFIASALAPAGIPLMILDHRLPVLEARARDLLSKMSNGRLDLKMSVIDSASKKGIDLFAGSSVLRPIKALSGGEQTRVALAIRMALSRMLAEMAGTRFDVLIVDEPPYLDPEGIDQLIESLTRLQGQFSQMFVVSHEEKLRDAFPQTIVVTNQNGISTAMIPSR
jgi:exonuclease SbcC